MLKNNLEMIKTGEGLWSQMNKSPGATKYKDFSKITREEWEDAFKALEEMEENRDKVEPIWYLMGLSDDAFIDVIKNPPKNVIFQGGSEAVSAVENRIKKLNIKVDD